MVLIVFLSILIIYGVGFAVVLRLAVSQWIREDEQARPHLYGSEQDYARMRDRAVEDCLFLALIWPLGWLNLLAARLTHGTIETDRLKRLRAEAELERVKELAKENGLSFPDA